MLVCDEHKFVFLRNPKTASRSITRALSKKFQCRRVGLYHSWKIPKEFLGHFVFATVRDPYTRSVSAWQHWLRTGKTSPNVAFDWSLIESPLWRPDRPDRDFDFERFSKVIFNTRLSDYPQGAHWKLQSEILDQIDTEVHLLKYENLEADLNSLPFIDNINLPRIGVYATKYGDWQQYYTPEVETRIYETLKPDFERFGYKRWYFDKKQIGLL